MRELEPHHTRENFDRLRIAIVGSGRLGNALADALRACAGSTVDGPLPRGATADGADVVLLCVPDAEIATAAALITPGPLVGHCSGATDLQRLVPHRAFSMHPLMTVTAAGADFRGAAAAIDGRDAGGLAVAERLARMLGLEPVRIAPEDRALYHAAASIASNFLVTLEAAAEQLAAEVGLDRRLLAPLVRASVENWATLGGPAALTGPAARGDEETVVRQRAAVAERAPELVALFDSLTEATRALAGRELEHV
jgi:predicted short-subunit dehydrogenase-like oxidoreductase (DUF2520 family)